MGRASAPEPPQGALAPIALVVPMRFLNAARVARPEPPQGAWAQIAARPLSRWPAWWPDGMLCVMFQRISCSSVHMNVLNAARVVRPEVHNSLAGMVARRDAACGATLRRLLGVGDEVFARSGLLPHSRAVVFPLHGWTSMTGTHLGLRQGDEKRSRSVRSSSFEDVVLPHLGHVEVAWG